MGVERIRLSPPRVGLGPESEKASPEVPARSRRALRARPSPAVRQHPGKPARRLQGETAAGAWGVATPGELRGCAGCEPGARATDVAWAGAAPALAKRGARFGAPSARLPEVPSASPSRDTRRGLPSAAGGRAGAAGSWEQEKNFGWGTGRRGRKRSQERDSKPKVCNLGKGGKKVGEEAETKKKKPKTTKKPPKNQTKKRRRDKETKSKKLEKKRLPGEQDSGNVDKKDVKREEPSGNGEEG